MNNILNLPARENYPAVMHKTFLISLLAHSLLFGALSWAFPLLPTARQPIDEGIAIDIAPAPMPEAPQAAAAPAPPQEVAAPEPPAPPIEEPAPQKAEKKIIEPVKQAESKPKPPKKQAQPKTVASKANIARSAGNAPSAAAQAAPAKAVGRAPSNPVPLGGSHTPSPPYPEMARKRNQQGTVRVRCGVDASGATTSCSVAQSSGHRLLDEAALKAVSKWKFKPASDGSGNVAGTVVVPVEFKLN